MEYQKIDMNTWPRRTHWHYYRNIVKAAISLTKKIDVTPVLNYCHQEKASFSAVFLHTVSKTVNSLDFMRMFALEDGNPAVWNVVHPNYTIFHEDDCTFSDVWIEYKEDLQEFLSVFHETIDRYGHLHGIKVRNDQPANFFCISGLPWLDYEACTTYTPGSSLPMLFPVINYGQYQICGDRYLMPLSISISHAAMDGYHVSQFYNKLQENINKVYDERIQCV